VPRSSSRPLFFALAALALAIACGPRATRKDEVPQRDASTTPAHDSSIAASTGVSVGSGVQFTLHVTNLHDRALELRFPTGQTHEFVVMDSAGREIWRSSQGRLYTQTLQNRLLDSRETLTFAERWDGAGRVGRFTAVARLASTNHPVEERVDFVLP
jgi:hypothetical protein